ncbi:MAG: aminotransferase class I/II-fold pyridoxal phosphate-dependent enzyme [Actinobacteria bacterium]|nr:MAG: aminotransferase class I/II-fold pyridoxal phosphate-dependent enzyme [Actinomycetota bacterium]
MVCTLFGAKAVAVPLAGDAHDLDAMLAAVTDRTRLLFVCNPNNPTGTIVRKPEFEIFLAKVPEHVLVVVDEAYIEFVTDSHFPDGMAYFDGERPLAVLRTFSKAYSLAGLRVGYGAMPEPLREAVDKVREPFNVNAVAQAAAFHSLDDDAEVARRRTENAEQLAALCAALDRLGVTYAPSQANFVYFHTAKPAEVFEALLAEGVIVRQLGPAPALRMTMPAPGDTEYVIAALEAAHAALGGF